MGNLALGYNVVNGTDVYPGIRYTGRLAGDALGQMTLGEGVIMNGASKAHIMGRSQLDGGLPMMFGGGTAAFYGD
jgi:hypothetical protein